ncbi:MULTISPECIES: ABC transporter permease [Priestia]|jgi:glycine betaine/proline transport system permease protein|uniref:Glycine betaine/L-proline ABC transporter, permease protein n=1 Tax=Priestia megaterium (strain WSH-002) TaxID=1006007 RepID=A0A8D4BQQ7_PRIMW|nr:MULTISPECIES: proline/glycine betaine ABC transporter permease [Priestia]AEN91263.1 Glycine betaine/L-proline ABC transporter, permease protein [Priestia megaterium WSH-002]MBU8686704.1 proline/glycine betaine ABC transporter permease [Priestia megaterium]MBY0062990.1 proline/glycine betaine ABC transporter permease [Priestia aryabhattai]MDN3360987.1 proline/glycine betaine ABC transporter permease [Priestia megaterium]MED3868209.1 proline/glycine betaine ABC transporter permease [Priestia 
MNSIPKIPVGNWIDHFVTFLNDNIKGFFDVISAIVDGIVSFIVLVLTFPPALILILIVGIIAWFSSKKWSFTILSMIGLLFILNLGYWQETMDTLALVLTSVLISIIVGIPLGIWASQSEKTARIITPILDFMQTMPAFVYLIPALFFFGIGVVPGVISSVIFAMPPTIRLTNLGIREVPADLVEAANAYGSTTKQKLFKVQLPLATKTIMAGINQSIMLSLSMVVIASLVGAPGLGAEVYRAVSRLEVGTGFEAGISIVILAIILDRITQYFGNRSKQRA